MNFPLLSIIKRGIVTQSEMFPDLPAEATGLPGITNAPCRGDSCQKCSKLCPTGAITVSGGIVKLDRGICIGCNLCVDNCPAGTISHDRSTKTAALAREDLILTSEAKIKTTREQKKFPFLRSLHIREVSTGDNIADLETTAASNPIFDMSRFGAQVVASPRFADALLVTGPVGKAMQEPLRRCYDAMAEPRLVIAAGVSAISGGLFGGGYAKANGVNDILPVSCYIPGDPPHPWSIIYGVLLLMGRI
jgi:Ni,Fe-hydrogenase III small subunit/NAD-dependent dihydropyrimidine dehydrogenase PreA subunit